MCLAATKYTEGIAIQMPVKGWELNAKMPPIATWTAKVAARSTRAAYRNWDVYQ